MPNVFYLNLQNSNTRQTVGIHKQREYNSTDLSLLREYNSLRGMKAQKRLCHAPFKSLRFSQSGNVLTCCFNRGHILGKIPEQSVHAIWFGKKMKELQYHISENDLSLGCGECARRIKDRLFNLSGMLQYDYLAVHESGKYPAMLDFEISNTCNLECVMCLGENSSAIRCNREKLPPCEQHYTDQFVEQLKEFIPHIKEARFSGGEPFLIPLYYNIWELIISMNPSAEITVLTNATILNDKVKDLLSKGIFRISVSIDSFEKETYEKIRLKADFNTVKNNLEYFYNYSLQQNSIFCLNVCPVPYNWAEIPSMVRYCNEKNIRLVLHSVIFPPSESLWAMEGDELKKIFKQLENENIAVSNLVGENNFSVFRQFIAQVSGWAEKAEMRKKMKNELSGKNENELLVILRRHLPNPNGDSAYGIIEMLLNSGFTENERKNIILNLMSFPSDLIISELLHNEQEKMRIRLKSFNY